MVGLFMFFILQLMQLLTLIQRPINIFPELFYYPWLVSKGLLPYRDFFDHHGFLLYYFFAPFVQDKSLFILKLFFSCIQFVNLWLFLSIIQRHLSKKLYLGFGVLFILMNLYLAGNSFWFEHIILTFYLVIYKILYSKMRHREIIIGILIMLVSYIKPNAAIILIPCVIILKQLDVVIPLVLGWVGVGIYFYINHGFNQLISYLFIFNKNLPQQLLPVMSFSGDRFFLTVSILIFIATIFILWKSKRLYFFKTPLIFTFCSLIFVLVLYGRVHFLIFFTFMFILEAGAIQKVRIRYRTIGMWMLLFYSIFVIYLLVKEQKQINTSKGEYIKVHTDQKLIAYLKEMHLGNKPFFVFGNYPEYYYLFNQLPPVHMSIILHDIYKPQFPDMENNLIKEISKRDVFTIIIPYPIDPNYLLFVQLLTMVEKQYSLLKMSDTFRIYVKTAK